MSQIGSKIVISETDHADSGVCGGGSNAPIGGLVMQRCYCGNFDDGGVAVTVDVDIDVSVA